MSMKTTRTETIEMTTREQAIDALVERDVARWGESERAASRDLRSVLTHGLALHSLAYGDLDHIDMALAAAAKRVMTPADRRVLRSAG